MTVPDLIAAVNDRLTPTERRIAEAVLEDSTLLAFGTVAELAARVGTSKPTIVRFAAKLGFDGFTRLQEHVRDAMTVQLTRPSQRIRARKGTLAETRASIEHAIANAFDGLTEERVAALAEPIVRARNVWVLSGETSRAGAHVFRSGMSIVRPGVHLVEEHSSGRELAGAGPGDVAVAFDFARYRRHAVTAARTLAEMGVDIVAITDGPLSPLASLTENWCALTVPAIGPFDSSLPAVAAAELLVAHVAEKLRDVARKRIDRTEALWKATGTFFEA